MQTFDGKITLFGPQERRKSTEKGNGDLELASLIRRSYILERPKTFRRGLPPGIFRCHSGTLYKTDKNVLATC